VLFSLGKQPERDPLGAHAPLCVISAYPPVFGGWVECVGDAAAATVLCNRRARHGANVPHVHAWNTEAIQYVVDELGLQEDGHLTRTEAPLSEKRGDCRLARLHIDGECACVSGAFRNRVHIRRHHDSFLAIRKQFQYHFVIVRVTFDHSGDVIS
jgi:hypothetical protein